MFCATSGALRHLLFQIFSIGTEQTLAEHFEQGHLLQQSRPLLERIREKTLAAKIANLPAVSIIFAEIKQRCLSVRYRETSYGQFLFQSNLLPEFEQPENKIGSIGYKRNSFGIKHIWPASNAARVAVCVTTRDNKMIIAKRHAANVVCSDAWMTTVSEQINPSLTSESLAKFTAYRGLEQEMGREITRSCGQLICLGIADRLGDYYHPALMFRVFSSLEASRFIDLWHKSHVVGRQEFAEEDPLLAIDISSPHQLLEHLTAEENKWSPQHAACALLVLAQTHEKAVREAGLRIPM